MKYQKTLRILALLPVLAQAGATSPEFLKPARAVAEIMDGQPWSARTSDGHDAKLTLNSEGGGQFAAGPLSFHVAWSVKRDLICIDVGPAGEKCLRFKSTAHGFEGWNGERLDLSLWR